MVMFSNFLDWNFAYGNGIYEEFFKNVDQNFVKIMVGKADGFC